MTNTPTCPQKYVPEFDGLRAVAVLAVVAFHARTPWLDGGFLGVDIFFVLSGFLITRLLFDEHRRAGCIGLGAFYVRRLRRLYPALIVVVLTYLAIAWSVFPGVTDHVRDSAVALFYLSDYGRAFWRVPVVLQHTWSLSIEEHFYLVWPVVLVYLLKRRPDSMLRSMLALFLLATGWRWVMVALSWDWAGPYYRFDTRLAGLLLGGCLVFWRPRRAMPFAWIGVLLLGIAFLLADWRGGGSLTWMMTCAEIGTALMLLDVQRLGFLRIPSLVWLGKMSYGIYLWHYPIVYWMRHEGFAWQEVLAASCVFSVVLAAISYYLVERHFHRRRAREANLQGATAEAGAK